jgi:hypothetical protein
MLVEVKTDVKWLRLNVENLDKAKVSHDEFNPVKRVVYGVVGLVLAAVAGGVIALLNGIPA